MMSLSCWRLVSRIEVQQEKHEADVIVTGWQERSYVNGQEQEHKLRHRKAPHLERGIDDMLKGRGTMDSSSII